MKHYLSFTLVFLFALQGFADAPKLGLQRYAPLKRQADGSSSIRDRLLFGGNVGLQFGNPTTVLVSPSVAYMPPAQWLKNKLMVGVGATYMYSKVQFIDPNSNTTINYTSNIYGGRVFTRCMISRKIFAYVEYEFLNAPNYNVDGSPRQWVNSFYVGPGYWMPFSRRGGFSITVLYNLAWTPANIIYSSPWNIRIGFMF